MVLECACGAEVVSACLRCGALLCRDCAQVDEDRLCALCLAARRSPVRRFASALVISALLVFDVVAFVVTASSPSRPCSLTRTIASRGTDVGAMHLRFNRSHGLLFAGIVLIDYEAQVPGTPCPCPAVRTTCRWRHPPFREDRIGPPENAVECSRIDD